MCNSSYLLEFLITVLPSLMKVISLFFNLMLAVLVKFLLLPCFSKQNIHHIFYILKVFLLEVLKVRRKVETKILRRLKQQ